MDAPDALRGRQCHPARVNGEAGVRLVTVYWGGKVNNPTPFWDTHFNNNSRLRDELLPPFDQCFSAFLEDMASRGLLDSTLVVCMGEFGRTPRFGQFTGNGVNETGRDHWSQCYSLVLAGGRAPGGRVLGRSDRFAAYPASDHDAPPSTSATAHAPSIRRRSPFLIALTASCMVTLEVTSSIVFTSGSPCHDGFSPKTGSQAGIFPRRKKYVVKRAAKNIISLPTTYWGLDMILKQMTPGKSEQLVSLFKAGDRKAPRRWWRRSAGRVRYSTGV